MNNSKQYKNLEDVIKHNYMIPLSYYKNEKFSRYSETYDLMRNRENQPVSEAVKKAYDISMNSKIHPAIIRACKTHYELDLYISCLEDDNLSNFKIFDIIIEKKKD